MCTDRTPETRPPVNHHSSGPPAAAPGRTRLFLTTAPTPPPSGTRCRAFQTTPSGRGRPPCSHPFGTRRGVTPSDHIKDRLRVRSLPLGVHMGDHLGVHLGDPVRTPPPSGGDDAGQGARRGIRWYPRLACPQAGEHIGAGSWSTPKASCHPFPSSALFVSYLAFCSPISFDIIYFHSLSLVDCPCSRILCPPDLWQCHRVPFGMRSRVAHFMETATG